MIVLGIDPGIIECGLALADVTVRRCLLTKTIRQSSSVPASDRIGVIGIAVADLVPRADLVVCEDQDSVFWAKQRQGESNPSAAKLMALVEHVHAVALMSSKPFLQITPLQMRKLMGCKPDASKAVLARAARIQCSGIPLDAKTHETDAIVAAITGARKWHRDQTIKTRRAG